MQSLNGTSWFSKNWSYLHPKYMVNYNSIRKQIQHINKNYPYTMATWHIILITTIGALMIGGRVTIFISEITKYTRLFLTSSIFWYKENLRKAQPMLSDSPQQLRFPKNLSQPWEGKKNTKDARYGFLQLWQVQSHFYVINTDRQSLKISITTLSSHDI